MFIMLFSGNNDQFLQHSYTKSLKRNHARALKLDFDGLAIVFFFNSSTSLNSSGSSSYSLML